MIKIKADLWNVEIEIEGDETIILAEITNAFGAFFASIAHSSNFLMNKEDILKQVFPMLKLSFEEHNQKLKEMGGSK